MVVSRLLVLDYNSMDLAVLRRSGSAARGAVTVVNLLDGILRIFQISSNVEIQAATPAILLMVDFHSEASSGLASPRKPDLLVDV